MEFPILDKHTKPLVGSDTAKMVRRRTSSCFVFWRPSPALNAVCPMSHPPDLLSMLHIRNNLCFQVSTASPFFTEYLFAFYIQHHLNTRVVTHDNRCENTLTYMVVTDMTWSTLLHRHAYIDGRASRQATMQQPLDAESFPACQVPAYPRLVAIKCLKNGFPVSLSTSFGTSSAPSQYIPRDPRPPPTPYTSICTRYSRCQGGKRGGAPESLGRKR